VGLTDGQSSGVGYGRADIVSTLLSKIAASLAVALSVAAIYLSLLRITSRRGAIVVSLIYAFATSSWAVTSQGLWQESMSQPMLAWALYMLVRGRDDPRSIPWAGLPIALAVASRPPTIVFAIAFTAYVAWSHRAQLARFLAAPVVVGGMLIAYNAHFFGSLFGPYSGAGGVDQFSYPNPVAFFGLLISPSRGLLVLSPVLFFACLGLGRALAGRLDPLFRFTAVAIVLTVVTYSAWEQWDGAFTYSYRFLTDVLPGLALFLGVMWSWVVAQRWRLATLTALAVFSVWVQMVGAFNFPCGWPGNGATPEVYRQRLWDWTDSELARCVQSGPVDPDGLKFARQILFKQTEAGTYSTVQR
jgi:hypothetical protein